MTADEVAQRDANKALYRRWFEEVVSEGNLALADELLADDCTMHFPGPDEPVGREGHKQLVTMFRAGFPNWVETVEDVIAEGDRVVIRVVGQAPRPASSISSGSSRTWAVATAPASATGLDDLVAEQRAKRPPRTKLYSSSHVCRCGDAASARGDIGVRRI